MWARSIEAFGKVALFVAAGIAASSLPTRGEDAAEATFVRVKPEGASQELLLSSMIIPPGGSTALQWWCQGIDTGRITWSLKATDNGAGHQHSNSGRPTGNTSVDHVTIPCDGNLHTSGSYTAPKVSGLVRMTMFINGQPATPPYFDFIVQVQSLVRLPRSSYIKEVSFSGISEVLVRSPPHDHPNNHWGKPELNSKILVLAQRFFAQRNKKIFVNDMSLPQGGILDFNNTWAPPHTTHRDGRHVDIRMIGAMNAGDIAAFRTIAESIFGKRHVCIDGGTHWHLVIETECRDTALAEWGLSVDDLKPWVRREMENATVRNQRQPR